MKTSKRNIWLIAVIGVIAGLLMGIWVGAQLLPRLQTARFSDLDETQQDQYVVLVALGYDAIGDLDDAIAQLNRLDTPNLQLLVSGVLERAARQGVSAPKLTALAQLALGLGAPRAALTDYLPTATATALPPTSTPLPTATPAPSATPAPVATSTPSATLAPTATPAATATPSPLPVPQVAADDIVNVRSGPGLLYPVIGALQAGESAPIIAQNAAGDWWQIMLPGDVSGWVYAPLLSASGDLTAIPIAANIPAPPATATPAATATPLPPAGPDFRIVARRLWGVEENGGQFVGPSVHCGGKHELHIKVIDAAGAPLNGVTLRSLYDNEEHISGEKGPGIAEWILYAPGNGVRVVRDVDGSDASSDAIDAPTDPRKIANSDLIAGGFCNDDAACNIFKEALGCYGHYSWEVTFQRTH